jgi:hypothetical protein
MATDSNYTVAILCAMEFEMSAVRFMLDQEHLYLSNTDGDSDDYILSHLSGHDIVITYLPAIQGKSAAAVVVTNLDRTIPSIQWRFLAAIRGGVSSQGMTSA